MSFNTLPVINQRVPTKQVNAIRIMTYNVHGFNSKDWKDTTDDIYSQIQIINPDIFGIQEMHLGCPDRYTMLKFSERFESMGYKIKFSKCFVNMLGSKYDFESDEICIGSEQGLMHRCAIIGNHFQFPVHSVDQDDTKSIIEDKSKLVVATTHLEVNDKMGHLREQQMQKIIDKINQIDDESNPKLIIGDFNSLRKCDYSDVVWDQIVDIDKRRGVETIEDAIPCIEKAGYHDSFIAAKIPVPSITVWTNRRVDYIYLKHVHVDEAFVVNTGLSDHYPVVSDIVI